MTAQTLKKSLLNYAICGKLSAKWRNSRISENSHSKFLENSKDFEPPFEIPNSWEWVKLGDIGEYKKGPFGSALTKSMFVSKSENSIKVYGQKNAIKKNFELGDYFITKEYFLEKMQGFIVKPNDIIISCAGTIGEVYKIPQEAPQGIINQALMRVRLNHSTIFEWFNIAFDFIITANSHQAKGTAIKNIPPFSILKNLYIPLPPKDEQEFIVSELEKLMSLADNYEEQFQKLEHCNKELKSLEKSLLNYAICGKLSAKWRNSRISENSNSKHADVIPRLDRWNSTADFKPPFEIPNSWEWVKLGDICEIYTGNSINKDFKEKNFTNVENGIPYIATKDLENEIFNYENGIKITNNFLPNFKKAKPNSILMCIEGGSAGRKIGILSQEVCFGNKLCCFYSNEINLKFLFYFFKSALFYTIFTQNINGIIGGVSIKKLQNLYTSLPPKDEQEFIVSELEKLMSLCKGI